MAKNIQKKANPFNTLEWVWSLFGNIWGVAKNTPFVGWLTAIWTSYGVGMVAYFDDLPNTVIVLSILLTVAVVIFIVERIIMLKQRLSFDPKKYQDHGRQLSEKSQEMREFLFSKYEIYDLTKSLPQDYQERLMAEGKRQVDLQAVNVQFQQKYGPEILYQTRLLKSLGVAVPFHIGASYGRSPHQFPDFLNHVGKLLEEGYLEEARNIDDEFGFRFSDSYLT